MKKIHLFASIAIIAAMASCSNETAYSEEEKKSQDSLDNTTQEDKFKDMESQMGGDTAKPKMGGKNMPMQTPVNKQNTEKLDKPVTFEDENDPNKR